MSGKDPICPCCGAHLTFEYFLGVGDEAVKQNVFKYIWECKKIKVRCYHCDEEFSLEVDTVFTFSTEKI